MASGPGTRMERTVPSPQPQPLVTCVGHGSRAETKRQHTLAHTDMPTNTGVPQAPRKHLPGKDPPRHPRTSLPQGWARKQCPPGKGAGTEGSLSEGAGPRARAEVTVPVPGPECSLALRGRASWPLGPGRPHCGCVKGSSMPRGRGLWLRPCDSGEPRASGEPRGQAPRCSRKCRSGGSRTPGGPLSSGRGGMHVRESWLRPQGLGAPGRRRSKPGETRRPRRAPGTAGPGSTWKVQSSTLPPTRSWTAAPPVPVTWGRWSLPTQSVGFRQGIRAGKGPEV